MKLSIRTPDGRSKTRECSDEAGIEIMLKRGWKEVPSSKPKPQPKPKAKVFSKKKK